MLLAAPLVAEAQQSGKVYRIGFILTATPNETEHLTKALSEGLGSPRSRRSSFS